MKKFFLWLRGWSPWYLRARYREIRDTVQRQALELAGAPDEPTARAMLLQLRVHQESVRQRTGYMVSAFIPSIAVEKLTALGEAKQKQFAGVVAEVLVNNALSGVLRRHQSTNKLTALIFEPVTKRGQNVQLAGAIFETDQGPDKHSFVPLSPNVPEFKQLHDAK